jgi:hypothetical protein
VVLQSIALLEQDEALQKARDALAAAQTTTAEKETALAMVQAQLQRDRTTLEGARSWQTQAKEKAKEVERLGVDLADKVASLAAWGNSSFRRKAPASRRSPGSSRSSPPSRRPRPPSSVNARP